MLWRNCGEGNLVIAGGGGLKLMANGDLHERLRGVSANSNVNIHRSDSNPQHSLKFFPQSHLYLFLDSIFGKGGPQSWLNIKSYLGRVHHHHHHHHRIIIVIITVIIIRAFLTLPPSWPTVRTSSRTLEMIAKYFGKIEVRILMMRPGET